MDSPYVALCQISALQNHFQTEPLKYVHCWATNIIPIKFFTQNSRKDNVVSRRATGILFQLSDPEMASARGPEILEQLDRRVLQPAERIDDAAQTPWRPT